MANEEWRSMEILKLLRQCVVCPYCGVLVATQAGIDSHIAWHDSVTQFTTNTDEKFEQFSDYIINPETGLQKQIQDRLDVISNYVVAPTTGLEARVTVAITAANTAITTLRNDATAAIGGTTTRIATIEDEITRPTNGVRARLSALELRVGP